MDTHSSNAPRKRKSEGHHHAELTKRLGKLEALLRGISTQDDAESTGQRPSSTTSRPKRRKLNYDKCIFCRKDKKKCEPHGRQWPGQRCKRCEQMDLECSGNSRATDDSAASPPAVDSDVRLETPAALQSLETEADVLKSLNIRVSWFIQCQRICRDVEVTETSYAAGAGLEGPLSDMVQIITWVRRMRKRLRREARQILRSSSSGATLKSGVVPIVDSLISISQTRNIYTSPELFNLELGDDEDAGDDDDDVPAQIGELEASGHIGSALAIQEDYLNRLGPATREETWRHGFQRYCELYLKFRAAYMSNSTVYERYPCPPERGLPFMGSTSILPAAVRYFPDQYAKDVFDRTLLHLALYRSVSADIKTLINRSQRNLNAQDCFGRTPLHIAATMGSKPVVLDLLSSYAHANPPRHPILLSPLCCAATAGHAYVAELILTHLFTQQPGDEASVISHAQSAIELATANGHEQTCEVIVEALRRRVERNSIGPPTAVALKPQFGGTALGTGAISDHAVATLGGIFEF